MPEPLTPDQIANLVQSRLRQSREEGVGLFTNHNPRILRRMQLAEAGVPESILNLLKTGISAAQRADLARQGVNRSVIDLLSTQHSLSSGFLGYGALSDQQIDDATRFVRAIPRELHAELGIIAAPATPVGQVGNIADVMNAHNQRFNYTIGPGGQQVSRNQPAQGTLPNALPPAFPVQAPALTNFPLTAPPQPNIEQPGMLLNTNPPTSLDLDTNRSALADRMTELMTGPQFEGRRNSLAGGQSPLAQAMGLMSGRLQPPPPPAPPQPRPTPQMLGSGGLQGLSGIEDPARRAQLGLNPYPDWNAPSAQEVIGELDARTERQREEQRRRLLEALGSGVNFVGLP